MVKTIVESLSHEINNMGENVMFSIEIKECLNIIRQMTPFHSKSLEFKNFEESVMKKFDEIISRMTRTCPSHP